MEFSHVDFEWLRIIGAIIENVIRYDVVLKTAVRRTWYI
jgi:hypothetical protein